MSPQRPILNECCRPGVSGDLLRVRSGFLRDVRDFFHQRDFLEVETPLLIPAPDPSPHLDSFRTRYTAMNAQETELFLHTSPEFAMKRMVALGYPRLFQICKFFRNGEISPHHNPEFTGLEWYLMGADYHSVMSLTEELVRSLWPEGVIHYQGNAFDISVPWERLTVFEAMNRYAEASLQPGCSYGELSAVCTQKGLSVAEDDTWDDLFFKIFLTYVEPELGKMRPTFLMDYPIEMAALARPKPDEPRLAERVELYIGGLELCNGYSELTDPEIQRSRWEEEWAYRRERGEEVTPERGLLNALAWGMDECTGVAVGLDRLLMLKLDTTCIEDVLPFPMKEFVEG